MGCLRRGAWIPIVAVAAGLSAAAVTTVTSAPAHGAVSSLRIAPPGGTGKYGAGCSYTVTARVTGNGPVVFSVRQPTRLRHGGLLTFTNTVVPERRIAVFHWSPVVEGRYVLAARQQSSGKWVGKVADVSAPLDLGSTCSGL
ncbi:hypothetical protein ACWDTD_10265 [Gordonia sp. NPDC003425]